MKRGRARSTGRRGGRGNSMLLNESIIFEDHSPYRKEVCWLGSPSSLRQRTTFPRCVPLWVYLPWIDLSPLLFSPSSRLFFFVSLVRRLWFLLLLLPCRPPPLRTFTSLLDRCFAHVLSLLLVCRHPSSVGSSSLPPFLSSFV